MSVSGHSHHLRVTDLTVSYRRIPALHHVAFEIPCGSAVAVLGPNGAGKSTLLKALCGLVAVEGGEVWFHGRRMTGPSREFAYLPQRESVDWDFPMTVRGLVETGRYLRTGWWRRFGAADSAAVDTALRAVDMEALQERQISALSGGQQQRAFLARAMAQEAHVMLLDEPFTGLDVPSQEGLRKAIVAMRAAGKLLLVTHHDLETVRDLFDHVVLLNGEQVAAGPVAECFTEQNLTRAFSARVFSTMRHGMAI